MSLRCCMLERACVHALCIVCGVGEMKDWMDVGVWLGGGSVLIRIVCFFWIMWLVWHVLSWCWSFCRGKFQISFIFEQSFAKR